MPRQRRYVLIALVLQLGMVLLGQVSDTVLDLSGVFGMGIPLVVGWLCWWCADWSGGRRRRTRAGDRAQRGLLVTPASRHGGFHLHGLARGFPRLDAQGAERARGRVTACALLA